MALQITFSKAASAALGVFLAEAFMRVVAPKLFTFAKLEVQKLRSCCKECESGKPCKNITDRSQVIDITPDSGFQPGDIVGGKYQILERLN